METDKLIRNTTLLLCFVAGYCDTLTFVSAGELFSAHVTGNFIVFAYDVIMHTDSHAWQKLLTFPVFIISVMVGAKLAARSSNIYFLLMLQAVLLSVSGITALFLPATLSPLSWQIQSLAIIIVIAMAFQNTFGKLYNKATYGLTTVMTGNVTQVSIDLMKVITGSKTDPEVNISLSKQLILISGFLTGCLGGAVMAGKFGMVAVLIPAMLMIIWLINNKLFSFRPINNGS